MSCYIVILVILMLDSVMRVNKKHYLQILLEECKYEMKNNKMGNLINDDLDLNSSDNETDSDSDNEADNESDNDEFNEWFVENWDCILIIIIIIIMIIIIIIIKA